jgi:hypothetical protein
MPAVVFHSLPSSTFPTFGALYSRAPKLRQPFSMCVGRIEASWLSEEEKFSVSISLGTCFVRSLFSVARASFVI